MAEGGLGPWLPLSVVELTEVMVGAKFRWWVAGGQALVLHLGADWRRHDDIDLGIQRHDAPGLRRHLGQWAPFVAAAGTLREWDGAPLDAGRRENNIWWRMMPEGPWVLDTTLGEGDRHMWIYRREPAVRRPWGEAVLHSRDGVPYLAPELQLLFKSKGMRRKDQTDAEHVIPRLEAPRRLSLARLLPADHRWQEILAG